MLQGVCVSGCWSENWLGLLCTCICGWGCIGIWEGGGGRVGVGVGVAADDVELGSRTGQNMEGDPFTRGR